MTNDALRLTEPVWKQVVETGGMFNGSLSVYEDPDDVPLRFLATCRNGWRGGCQARRATLEEAKTYVREMYERGEAE